MKSSLIFKLNALMRIYYRILQAAIKASFEIEGESLALVLLLCTRSTNVG